MDITTEPACRVGWQGTTLQYVVRADGASEVVVPDDVQGLRLQITDMRQVGDGVEARLQAEVVDSSVY